MDQEDEEATTSTAKNHQGLSGDEIPHEDNAVRGMLYVWYLIYIRIKNELKTETIFSLIKSLLLPVFHYELQRKWIKQFGQWQ